MIGKRLIFLSKALVNSVELIYLHETQLTMSQMKNISFDGLQARLDEQLKYPSLFLFKFIAPLEKAQELVRIFAANPVTTKPSRYGNYISVTAELEMQSTEEIIEIYRAAARIEGVILL